MTNKKVLILVLAGLLLFGPLLSACTMREEIGEGGGLDPAQTERLREESTAAAVQTAAGSSAPAGDAGVDRIWEIYEKARDRNAALTALEENQLLYTKKGDSDESISLRLNMTGIGTEDVAVAAVGSVKTQGTVIPLEIYYRRGVQVRASGEKRTTEGATLEQVLTSVDFLQSFHRDLDRSCIRETSMEESADGMVTLSLTFDGKINGLQTAGRGEIMINEEGLIISEGYSFEAQNSSGTVSQSVECTLLAANGDVVPASMPENLGN